MERPDSELISRVLACEDQHAFGELVLRYQSPVRGFLTRLTRGDNHLADDIAQETFLKAWKKLHTFRGSARFSTWLFGIAFNEFGMEMRRRGMPVEEGAPQENGEASVDEGANLQVRIDLEEALKRLPTQERAAIVLCCQNGVPHEEAAEILKCPLGTVKTNILRGKEKLRRSLYEYQS